MKARVGEPGATYNSHGEADGEAEVGAGDEEVQEVEYAYAAPTRDDTRK